MSSKKLTRMNRENNYVPINIFSNEWVKFAVKFGGRCFYGKKDRKEKIAARGNS